MVIYKNFTEATKLLIKYADQHQIILKYEKIVNENNSEVIELLQNCERNLEEMKKVIKVNK